MNNNTLGWGKRDASGAEIWDDQPVFKGDKVELKDYFRLLFYPKKFFLYRYIIRAKKKAWKDLKEPFRILDVGCGTGADVIDFKKMFGREVQVIGIDVVRLQIELAEAKIKQNAVWADVRWYDGEHIPYPNNYFDAIYTSDVLGHVTHVPRWLAELNRVLKPGGALAMFAESKLGRHAFVRRYMLKRGLNADPHAEFHISLYSKYELMSMINKAGFAIKKMRTAFWLSFLVHPDEFYNKLQAQHTLHHKGAWLKSFPILRLINKILYKIKKKTHPYSTALCELYGLIEMMTIGRWVEAQGYIVLANKKEE